MIVTIENLCFSYGEQPVLAEVTLALPVGCLAVLAGPNGAGKSTLLKCLARMLSPCRGTVHVAHKPLGAWQAREYARIVSYMPQRRPAVFPIPAFDTVLMGRYPHLFWRHSARDIEAAWRAMGRLEIAEMAERSMDSLSGGEAQKIHLARSLAQDCPVMLLDEPVANLDVKQQLFIMEVLKEIAHQEGRSILMAIHDLNLAAQYADLVFLMARGKITAAGEACHTLTPDHIKDVYGVSAVQHSQDGLHLVLRLPPR